MISLTVNGKIYKVDAPPDMSLLWALRDHLGLTGTKYSCGVGECGSCTVLIDGAAQRSCSVTLEDAQGTKITTIEGLDAKHPVKRAWVEEQVVQCGYCQPGVMLQVASLLAESEKPDAQSIIDSMEDVICRCGTYAAIKRGIKRAVVIMEKEGKRS